VSILLDSLKQKQDDERIVVPTVHDSHFDDEMLNDDELIKSNRLWKLISIFLFIALSISWIYFYLDVSRNNETPTNISTQLTESKSVNQQSYKLSKPNIKEVTDVEVNSLEVNQKPAQLINDESSDGINKSKNNQYKPQKRVVAEDSSTPTNYSMVKTVQKKEPSQSDSNNDLSNDFSSSEDVIFYEELSTELLMELPNLEIGSYAVSSNSKKSFIVLNGSFYGVGETIAPNLSLLSIDKKSALFKYKSHLIKKKYK